MGFLVERACRRGRDEGGVIALLTLGFMTSVGFLLLFLLWSAGYTAGARTTLYGAAQSAAYAAASEVNYGGDQAHAQPMFDCGTGFDTTDTTASPICVNGRTANAARQAMAASLSRGSYGLNFGANVQLVDVGGNVINGVYAFEVGMAPGAAFVADPSCNGSVLQGTIPIRTCWKNPAANVQVRDSNFSSGIVVVAQATVTLPMCPRGLLGNICDQTIRVSVPARTAQQQVFLPSG
jgi:hypothetical protein